MLVGFHDGDRVWVMVEIKFEYRSQWRLGLRLVEIGFEISVEIGCRGCC